MNNDFDRDFKDFNKQVNRNFVKVGCFAVIMYAFIIGLVVAGVVGAAYLIATYVV